MLSRIWVNVSSICFLMGFGLSAQFFGVDEPRAAKSPRLIRPGVVFEDVTRNLAADRAGIGKGDLVLEWIQGNNRGKIDSPFDFMRVEIERSPSGRVVLIGMTGGVKK